MAFGEWDLGSNPAALQGASEQWLQIAQRIEQTASSFHQDGNTYTANWSGVSADSYQVHRGKLAEGLGGAVENASATAAALSQVCLSVEQAQRALDLSWQLVENISHSGDRGGVIVFEPKDEAEQQLVEEAKAEAARIRRELDSNLSADRQELSKLSSSWNEIAAAFSFISEIGASPFLVPQEGEAVGVVSVGGKTYFNGTSGDDSVRVETDPLTGDLRVLINGVSYPVPPGNQIVVRTGQGNDSVEVPSDSNLNFTVLGGYGNDQIRTGSGQDRVLGGGGDDKIETGRGNDAVLAGQGRDYVDGQGGDDLLSGGAGGDSIYGMGGDDRILGGSGQDYLEGAKGDDVIFGGRGNDVVSGGRGNDKLHGGRGDDVFYAGAGSDETFGGSGVDTAHNEEGDASDSSVETNVTIEISPNTSYIDIQGSAEFVERVEADLDLLSASPTGQQMLDAMQFEHDESGLFNLGKDRLTIVEYFPEEHDGRANSTASPGRFGNNTIAYMPGINEVAEGPPVSVLYHEMAHVYDYMSSGVDRTPYTGDDATDNGVKQGERSAVGIPIDHDHDPSTPERIDPDLPIELTENGLRAEMGMPKREHYRGS